MLISYSDLLGIGIHKDNFQRYNRAGVFQSGIGTITVTPGSPNIVGVGTTFTNYNVGDYIKTAAGNTREIQTITDDTNIVCTANFAANESAVNYRVKNNDESDYEGFIDVCNRHAIRTLKNYLKVGAVTGAEQYAKAVADELTADEKQVITDAELYLTAWRMVVTDKHDEDKIETETVKAISYKKSVLKPRYFYNQAMIVLAQDHDNDYDVYGVQKKEF